MFFVKEIEATRKLFSERKRKVKLPSGRPIPKWDPLYNTYTYFDEVLENGRICYGCIVQANALLYKRHRRVDCPAMIVYSEHPSVEEKPMILLSVADYLYGLKSKPISDIPEHNRELAEHIKNEYDRSSFTFSVNTDGSLIGCVTKIVMVFRSFLPRRWLKGRIIPVIVHDTPKMPAYIVPHKYWGRGIKVLWKKGML